MIVKNFGSHNLEDYEQILKQGGRFVTYDYCLSFIIISSKATTDIYLVRNKSARFFKSLGFTLIVLLFGWWALPFGPIFTIQCLYTNIRGGRDVTVDVMESVKKQLDPRSQYF